MLGCAALRLTYLACAAEQPSAFDAANQAFAESKLDDAAHGYESIIAKQGYSTPVLFNLANAQLRDGNTGAAILNYERARSPELDRAVVTAKEAVVRVSPVTEGQALFKLPEGSMVNIVRPHGGFALVRSIEGHQGWISRDVLSPVVSNVR